MKPVGDPGTAVREFDVLLFDLGGVLIDFAGFEELRRLLPDAPDLSTIRRRWIGSESVHLFESGAISAQKFALEFIQEWRLKLLPEDFLRDFARWPRGLYPGAAQLLRSLGKTHRLACLSNSNELHTDRHRRSLEGHIERFYFSNELGLAKPQLEIFDRVIMELDSPPERIAFFDDTEINVEAAENTGISACCAEGVQGLRNRLECLGLLDG
jgi:putative hydrolase of the HAD superfamily